MIEPYYEAERVTLYHGDCIDVMREMPDASVDAIVTDPPYGMAEYSPAELAKMLTAWIAGEPYYKSGGGFMGREWDSCVPGPDVWREALRVLKPGGHILAFSAPRTMDLMGLAIRLGGFEIRDELAWLFGSGFPKSLDVSKAIDAQDAVAARRARALRFTAWVRESGLTAAQINEITGTLMGSHYVTDKEQPSVAVAELFDKLRPYLPPPPDWVEEMVRERTVESENLKRREVIARRVATDTQHARPVTIAAQGLDGTKRRVIDVTTAHTDAAREWEGWGTALKPAYEPIVLARKPLIGTVAANVLQYGTGAINVDGCRIGTDTVGWGGGAAGPDWRENTGGLGAGAPRPVEGRWPANVLMDEEAAAILDRETEEMPSRYFYTAKASRSEREAGLAHIAPTRRTDGREKDIENPRLRTNARRNDHPTVKPVDLMAWLCRLVTPPGGLILDPFNGSGSTGMGALDGGFRYVGIEREEHYIETARYRIAHRHLTEVQTVEPSEDIPMGRLL